MMHNDGLLIFPELYKNFKRHRLLHLCAWKCSSVRHGLYNVFQLFRITLPNTNFQLFIAGIVNIEVLKSINTVNVEKEELNALISSTYDVMNKEYKSLSSKTLKEVGEKPVCER